MFDFALMKQCIVFVVVLLIARLLIILINIRKRRTDVPRSLSAIKRDSVRTLIVLGSGTRNIMFLFFGILQWWDCYRQKIPT